MQVGAADSGTGFLERVPDDRLAAHWDEQWRQAVLACCLEQVRPTVEAKTWQAFELFTFRGWPAKRVAETLQMSENAVFGARRRVLRRIRELEPEIDDV